jgi:hypothetical protein
MTRHSIREIEAIPARPSLLYLMNDEGGKARTGLDRNHGFFGIIKSESAVPVGTSGPIPARYWK